MSMILKDFLGNSIHVGDRGLRVHSYSNWKEFMKITVEKIDIFRSDKCYIGVITDGNTKVGWTYPDRILVQDSLTVKI